MSTAALMYLLVACSSEMAPEEPATSAPGEPAEGGLLLVGMDDLTVRWTASSGWTLGPTVVLGDVTGDGIADAITYAGAENEVSRALLVAGPLRRSLTLPGDELARFLGSGAVTAGDVTGDGMPELRLLATADRLPFIVEGPFAGEVDPLAVGIASTEGSKHADIDGDGILDLITTSYQQLSVTWGPMPRWSGPADLVLELPCGGDPNGYTYPLLQAFADMDDDGVREISIVDNDRVCPPLWFPLPSAPGVFAPEGDENTVTGVPEVQVIPDQTGDGLQDIWQWQTRVVHAAPVTFVTDGVLSATTLTADQTLTSIYPTEYDLDQDGLGDFISLDAEVDASEVQSSVGAPPDPVTGEVLVLISGGSDLVNPSYAMAWDVEGGAFNADDVFLEMGTVSVLVSHPTEGVIVVDLGTGNVP